MDVRKMLDTAIQDEYPGVMDARGEPRRHPNRHSLECTSRSDTANVLPKTATGVTAVVALWPKLVLFAIGMFVLLAAIEGALSWRASATTVPLPFNARQAAPYVEFYSQPGYHGDSLTTNSAGFRYGALPLPKPENETRIFFLSSSVGFRGDSNQTTIAGWMERLIKEATPDTDRTIRVINASGTSFNSTQSLVLLVTRILAYAPDIVVVFHGPESLLYPAVYESRPGYPFSFRVRERGPQQGGIVQMVSTVQSFQLMKTFHPDWGRSAKQAAMAGHNHVRSFDLVEDYDPYIRVVCEDVEKIVRIAQAYGCRTIVAVPPWKCSALLSGAVERLAAEITKSVNKWGRDAARFVGTLRLTTDLTEKRLWQSDGVHWNDEGNRLIALSFVDELLATGWLASRSAIADAPELTDGRCHEDRK